MNSKRRPRGSGSLRHTGKSTWRLCVSAGIDDAGNRVQHYKTVRASDRLQAERLLRSFTLEVERGLIGKGEDPTLKAYLSEWLSERAARVQPSTLRRYRRDVERFIVQDLGHLRLSRITPRHLDKAYSRWIEDRADGREGRLAPSTIAHAHRTLHAALSDANRQEILKGRNPAEIARPPAPIRKERRCLTREQASALLKASRGTRIELAVVLGLGCGLRRSEILALRWRDIDTVNRTLVVARSLEYFSETDGTKRFSFNPPKSKRPRSVGLPQFVVDALREEREQQKIYRLDGTDLVISRSDGSPLNPNAFTAAFRRVVKCANLPDCSPHTMRHTYASLALAAGENPLAVSQALGHYDPGFTLREYGHTMPGAQIAVADSIDAALLRVNAGQPALGAVQRGRSKL